MTYVALGVQMDRFGGRDPLAAEPADANDDDRRRPSMASADDGYSYSTGKHVVRADEVELELTAKAEALVQSRFGFEPDAITNERFVAAYAEVEAEHERTVAA